MNLDFRNNFLGEETTSSQSPLITRRDFQEKIVWILQDTQENSYVLVHSFLSELSDAELIEFLIENHITHLDISPLKWEDLERINRILTQNFPLIEILRLVAGENLININISGIKQINDVAGHQFCDHVIFHFKSILKNNLAQNKQKYTARVVRDDYKNIAFVFDSENPLVSLFWDLTEKKEIIIRLLKGLKNELQEKAKNIIDEEIKSGKIHIFSSQEYEMAISEKKSEIENIIHTFFDFWIGHTIIKNTSSNIDRLTSIKEAEISSRLSKTQKESISLQSYCETDIYKQLETCQSIKSEIISKYRGKKFSFDGVEYNVVIEIEGQNSPRLSTELLRYVRKYPKKVKPRELSQSVQAYIDGLNSSLDYISPLRWRLSEDNPDFQYAKNINAQIKNGYLMTQYLYETFKWGLTKEAFLEKNKGKTGIKVYIDIKDMGIENIFDFDFLAEQLLSLREKRQKGKISEKKYETEKKSLFLSAGKTVTDKFIEVQRRIQQLYPNANLRFGGDEIEIFIETENFWDIHGFQENIANVLNAAHQKARIVFDVTNSNNNTNNYTILERLSSLNKSLEEAIEQHIQTSWNQGIRIPNFTFLKMDDFVKEMIEREWFSIEELSKKFTQHIKKKDFWQKKKTEWYIWELEPDIHTSIKVHPNGEIEIYIYKF